MPSENSLACKYFVSIYNHLMNTYLINFLTKIKHPLCLGVNLFLRSFRKRHYTTDTLPLLTRRKSNKEATVVRVRMEASAAAVPSLLRVTS